MKKSCAGRVRRNITLVIAAVFVSVTISFPVMGTGRSQPQISQWSIGTLNEGERYGIYPVDWYYDGFRETISQERLNELVDGVDSKLSQLGLEKDQGFIPSTYKEDGTRNTVLIRLYNSIGTYKLPDDLQDSKVNAVVYMQERGIINGTNKGLALQTDCTVEQAVVFATRLIEDSYSAVGAGSKGLMWQVNNKGNTVYLLGSIHVGDTSLYPLHKDVKEAFKDSDMLLVEADVFNVGAELEEFMKMGMYTDGTSIKNHISEETYGKLVEFLELIGLPDDAYDGFKPWIIANELSTLMIADPNYVEGQIGASELGVDMYFLTTSTLMNKPIGELEGMVSQGNLFNNMPMEVQEERLNQILDDILNPESQAGVESADLIKLWFEKWNKGDIDGFAESFLEEREEAASEFESLLFGKRDKDMSDKLVNLLEKDGETTYFVVVGAGHLVEEGTIVDILSEKGYKVERFWE
ncbi:MAG: TraB/GumN family protein [Epulopiscium sp.]|nr:TraB/GumN family protein [Candidatus Epulonipiscium sp.]